jgi:P27 family predicted phage terminase small subunit
MGARGPMPEPTALRLLKGRTNHRKLPQGEPRVRALIPECPDHLPEAAQAKWAEVVSEMRMVPGWITLLDGDVLAIYCAAWARLVAADAFLAANGLTYEYELYRTEKNEETGRAEEVLVRARKAHPEVKIARDERVALMQLGDRLGLSPASRTRISIKPTDDDPEDLDD